MLAGSRTRSGKPLLANDPHLGIREPAIWYQSHLSLAGGLNVIGTTFPGVPGIVIGHHDHVAWGVTNVGPDVQDLYVETPNPENPQEFLYNGRYEKAQVLQEDIRVKGRKEPVPFTLLVTRHGPVISPVAGSKDERPAAAPALRWTALDPSPQLGAILGFDRAKNWPEFREALKQFTVPAQDFVNGKPVDDRYPYFMAAGWAPPYRIERCVGCELLPGRAGLPLTHSAPWRQVVDLADLAGDSFDVVTPGESGNPLSGHYADQAELWLQGAYHPQLFSEARLQDAQKLVLQP